MSEEKPPETHNPFQTLVNPDEILSRVRGSAPAVSHRAESHQKAGWSNPPLDQPQKLDPMGDTWRRAALKPPPSLETSPTLSSPLPSPVPRPIAATETAPESAFVQLGQKILALPYGEALEEFRRAYLRAKFEEAGHNMTTLSELTGLERTHLYRTFNRLGLETKRNKLRREEKWPEKSGDVINTQKPKAAQDKPGFMRLTEFRSLLWQQRERTGIGVRTIYDQLPPDILEANHLSKLYTCFSEKAALRFVSQEFADAVLSAYAALPDKAPGPKRRNKPEMGL